MLTLDSIIATTRQMSAFGEGRHAPVPRDRGAVPRTGRTASPEPRTSRTASPEPAPRDEDADPAERDA